MDLKLQVRSKMAKFVKKVMNVSFSTKCVTYHSAV